MEFTIDNLRSLADEAVAIRVSGVKAGGCLRFQLKSTDAAGVDWQSEADFVANDQGVIDLSDMAPIAGSYQTIDAMGLFWSMRPKSQEMMKGLYSIKGIAALSFQLSVYQGLQEVFVQTIDRCFARADITVQEIQTEQVTGILFLPAGEGPFPAVAMVPGSMGVLASQTRAALLASRGYAVLIIGYCQYKDLPMDMYEVPLERIIDGVRYLAELPMVDAERVTGFGTSKGAEGLLACMARVPDLPLARIILMTPSAAVWQGIGRGKPKALSTWSYQGQALPFLIPDKRRMFAQALKSILARKWGFARYIERLGVACFASSYNKRLNQVAANESALIDVSRVHCPVLFLAGSEDALWPCERMMQMMAERLPSTTQHEIVCYPKLGHMVTVAEVPATVNYTSFPGMSLGLGGEPQAVAQGSRLLREKILAFIAAA
jgi:dienelactone hydrolase